MIQSQVPQVSSGEPLVPRRTSSEAEPVFGSPPRRGGFASGCQAFGHRELLAVLRSFGLVMEPSLTVQH